MTCGAAVAPETEVRVRNRLSPAMDQDFCSIPDFNDRADVLEMMFVEFKRIAPFCPDGEKTFERLLELLDKLLNARSAADADHADQEEKEPDACDHAPHLLQLQRQLEKYKDDNRLLNALLHESEEDVVKQQAEKSMVREQAATLQKEMHSRHNELKDQISQLTEKLLEEEKKTKHLEQKVTVLRNQCAGRRKEAIAVKTLDQELREVRVHAATQTERKEEKTTEKRIRCLQLVHVSGEMIESTIKPSNLKLHSILIFLIVCVTQCTSSLTPVLFDDIVTYTSDGQAL